MRCEGPVTSGRGPSSTIKQWTRPIKLWTRPIKPAYKCTVHGPFRTYNDYLLHLKNWCQLVVTIMIIPLTLLLETLKVTYLRSALR